jgi:DNA-binding CsgD family transcriptional regulator
LKPCFAPYESWKNNSTLRYKESLYLGFWLKAFPMKRTILIFGLLITALIFLFQLGKYRIVEGDFSTEIVISVVSIACFFVGLYFRKYFTKEDETPAQPAAGLSEQWPPIQMEPVTTASQVDYKKIKELGISARELEVLNELVKGLSNKAISEKLFISESTTKTHLSNLFTKLNVSNRSQAIIRSNELNLVEKT